MNITFMIGNGFDVGLGMKSCFSDFFPHYISSTEKKQKLFQDFANEIDQNKKEWSYFELQIGQYTAKFTKETKNNMIEQFQDFETDFINYLRIEEENLCFEDKEEIEKVMKKALQHFASLDNLSVVSSQQIAALFSSHQSDEHKYNFISFNYTSALEKCLATISEGFISSHKYNGIVKRDRVGRVVHVHGTINHFPIMGPNDKSQISKKELAEDERFLRYILKPEINKAQRMNYDKDGFDLIEKSSIICVYGMSMGATDKLWWNKVLTWLAQGSERQLIIFAYDEKFSSSNHFQKLAKEDEIIDTLSQYPENKNFSVQALRDRIHVAIHRNIFEMKWLRKEIKIEPEIDAKVAISSASKSSFNQITQGLEEVKKTMGIDELVEMSKNILPM